MAYKGPFPHTNAGAITGLVVSATTFGGAVKSAGTISPNGIVVESGGGIIDSGATAVISGGVHVDSKSRIAANGGSTITAIDIFGATTFAWGHYQRRHALRRPSGQAISNSGTVAGGFNGIVCLMRLPLIPAQAGIQRESADISV